MYTCAHLHTHTPHTQHTVHELEVPNLKLLPFLFFFSRSLTYLPVKVIPSQAFKGLNEVVKM